MFYAITSINLQTFTWLNGLLFFAGVLLFPSSTLAARQCPANLTLDPSQNNACLLNGVRVGTAVDPASVSTPCSTGVPMIVSGSAACVNPDGKVLDLKTGQVAATQSPTGNSSPRSKYDATLTSCTGVLNFISSPFTCLWRSSATWLASVIIWLAVQFLGLAAGLFNMAIDHTVIQFNTWMTPAVIEAIGKGWALFRDLANIAIIGLFVFIAISIILGLKEYGEKKLIARVLIVATLINFSFLFTRIIINFSNSVSAQVSQQLIKESGASTTGGLPDIAGRFTDLMKVKTLFETKEALDIIAEKNNSAFISLGHALLTLFVLLSVAFTLLYAALLLLARAVIFVLLLITSSLAFATYLIPTYAQSDYGWKGWWSALLKNAALAPIMMMLFSTVITIADKLMGPNTAVGSAAAGTLGGLVTSPKDPGNVGALFSYLIVLGLLFATIKISSSLSTGLGQKFAVTGVGAALGGTVRSLGWTGRQTIGRAGAIAADRLAKRGLVAEAKGHTLRAAMFDLAAQSSKKAAKRDYNLGNTALAQAGAGLAGIEKKLISSKVGGFEGFEKKRNERNLHTAERLTYTDKQVNKMKSDARSEATKHHEPEMQKEKTGLQAAQTTQKDATAAKDAAERQKALLEKEMQDLKAQKAKIDEDKSKGLPTDHDREVVIEQELASKQSEMGQVESAISRAVTTAQTAAHEITQKQENIKVINTNISNLTEENTIKNYTKAGLTKEQADAGHHTRLNQTIDNTAYGTILDIPFRKKGWINTNNSRVIAGVRKDADTHHENKDLDKMIKRLTQKVKGGDDHPAPAAADGHAPEAPHH